jgi:CheY-like chemotaxis protein
MSQPSERSRLRARERVLATLSHEIRTPLNGVLGMAGLLAGTRLDATQAAYLQALRDCGEHLLALVNDVLDYAKLDAQPVRLEPTPTDIEALLQGVCELLSPRAYAAGIEIAWCTQGPIPRLLADDGRLRQILFNLAGNAVKMTAEGGVRLIAAATPAPGGRIRLRLAVADTGPGISTEARAGIFDEFVQTEAGEAAGGAGLGLAIVRRLAEAFDGHLGVESTPGMGATFWFQADFDRAAEPATRPTTLAGADVAIVSPSATVRETAAAQIAASGGTACAAASYGDIDPAARLVLVDAALGRGSRFRLKPPKGVSALILLAPEERKRIPAARAAGFAGYLIKPLRRASVAARLSALLLETQGEKGQTPVTAQAEDERAAAPAPIHARVLLAEDNPVNALLARTLLTHAGCTVERVVSGEEAITAAQTTPFDLILMDLRMPGIDGLTAARRLRATGMDCPIVALTANAFDEDRRACLEAGMNDFLTKPLDPHALRGILARWVSQPALPSRTAAAA